MLNCLLLALPICGQTHAIKPKTEILKRVTIERGWCFGSCPVYQATLHSTGKLAYYGEAHVQNIGNYVATFESDSNFKRLQRLIGKQGFWEMKPKYTVDKNGSHITDQPSYLLSIVTNKRSKTIESYGDEYPDGYWVIQCMVDGLIQNASDWSKIPDPNLPAKLTGKYKVILMSSTPGLKDGDVLEFRDTNDVLLNGKVIAGCRWNGNDNGISIIDGGFAGDQWLSLDVKKFGANGDFVLVGKGIELRRFVPNRIR